MTNEEAPNLLPAMRMNSIDRAISFFAPEAGMRRMLARQTIHTFGYNDNAERRGKPPPLRGSESWINNRDRIKMMADARDLCTHDFIGGMIGRIVLYVCGKIHCKSMSGDPVVNQQYDDFYHGWCGDELTDTELTRCDITGRHRHLKQVQMAFAAHLIDGDHGLLEIAPEFSPSAERDSAGEYIPETGGFCLQNISADRIGSPLEADHNENYIGGITTDPETGRIITIRTYQRTRANQYINPQEHLPETFIHVFDPDKEDEYRGRTKLLRLLNDARDIREWVEAEKLAGKTQSQWAAMFASKDPFKNTGPDAWSGKTTGGTPTQDAMWGKILKMGEGESFSMLSPAARPSGAFLNFVDTVIRKMAVSLNLPYGFLWNLATLGGVTARIEVQQAQRQIEYWQNNILVGKILNRVRQKVIAEGIARQILPAVPGWKLCEWNFGMSIQTDVAYEADSDITLMTHGVIPVSDVIGKYGHTPSEVFKSNVGTANEALAEGAQGELPVETFALGLYPQITAQKAAFLADTPLPPPLPGSIDAIGDKGVGKLLELLEKIGDGTIDRDAGIHTLINVFGMSRTKAEKICPEAPSEADLNREAGLDSKGRHAPVATASNNGSSPKRSSTKARK